MQRKNRWQLQVAVSAAAFLALGSIPQHCRAEEESNDPDPHREEVTKQVCEEYGGTFTDDGDIHYACDWDDGSHVGCFNDPNGQDDCTWCDAPGDCDSFGFGSRPTNSPFDPVADLPLNPDGPTQSREEKRAEVERRMAEYDAGPRGLCGTGVTTPIAGASLACLALSASRIRRRRPSARQ